MVLTRRYNYVINEGSWDHNRLGVQGAVAGNPQDLGHDGSLLGHGLHGLGDVEHGAVGGLVLKRQVPYLVSRAAPYEGEPRLRGRVQEVLLAVYLNEVNLNSPSPLGGLVQRRAVLARVSGSPYPDPCKDARPPAPDLPEPVCEYPDAPGVGLEPLLPYHLLKGLAPAIEGHQYAPYEVPVAPLVHHLRYPVKAPARRPREGVAYQEELPGVPRLYVEPVEPLDKVVRGRYLVEA